MYNYLEGIFPLQKNISYLTDNFPKQGYKVLFFPLLRCNYGLHLIFFLPLPLGEYMKMTI